jgi:hypothetical protein
MTGDGIDHFRGRRWRRGLLRAWVVVSTVWLLAFAAHVYFKVWGDPVCFALYTIGWADRIPDAHAAVVNGLKSGGFQGKQLCGLDGGGDLAQLEFLAADHTVEQISIIWKEPAGWSFEIHNTLDVLGKYGDGEITANEIRGRAARYAHEARLKAMSDEFAFAIGTPLLVLLLGFGVGWVVRGFK